MELGHVYYQNLLAQAQGNMHRVWDYLQAEGFLVGMFECQACKWWLVAVADPNKHRFVAVRCLRCNQQTKFVMLRDQGPPPPEPSGFQ